MRYASILVAVFATACGTSLAGPDAGATSTTTGANNSSTSSNGGNSSSGGVSSTGSGGGSSTGGATSSGGSSGGSTTGGSSTGGGSTTGTGSGGSSTGGTTGGGTTGGTGGLAAGSPCTGNAQCLSTVCGIAGLGNCCTATCDTSDAQCGATACDATGACVFPPVTAHCGASTCSGNTLTFSTCNGSGQCAGGGGAGPCPGNFVCQDGTQCFSTCTDKTACVSGFYCNASACVAQKATGPCNTNEACTSGICGVAGTGSCCTATCDISDPQCGATDCDALGACLYPGAKTSCGASGCSGSTLTSASCDGTGVCGTAVDSPCPGDLVCADATSCLQQCASASDCANSGDVCDSFNKQRTCCTGPGSTIYVDNGTGTDAACCGSSTSPCQTLTRAMEMIGATELTGATIVATVNGGGGDWSEQTETLPITLAWGVTVQADGVYFTDGKGVGTAVFDVNATSQTDTSGFAVLQGGGSGPDQIVIGTDSTGNRLASTDAAITVQSGMSLFIDYAWVNGNSAGPTNGIGVKGGANLLIGQFGGQLTIGGDTLPNGNQALSGERGIVCGPGTAKVPSTVVDTANLGFASIQISHQAITDIEADDWCTIDLEDGPILGSASSGGFTVGKGGCSAKNDSVGVLADGNATVVLGAENAPNVPSPATIQCMQLNAIQLEDFNGVGGPTLNLVGTVQNSEVGLLANAGTATVLDSTFQYNYRGVEQGGKATVDLSGNAGSDPNTVVCSSNQESFFGSTDPGIDVYNLGGNSLAADNVTWDTASPDYFDCESTFTNNCTCNSASCSQAGPFDDMDAVEDSNRLGGITVTSPTQSSSTSCQ